MDLLWLSSLSFLTKKAFLLKFLKALAAGAVIVLPGAIPVAIVAAFFYKIYQKAKEKNQSLTSTNDQ